MLRILLSLVTICITITNAHAQNRKHIVMVGSSTVYPFATIIAEEFGRNAKLYGTTVKTPIVESTGTGGGFKLFCSGVGYQYPDFSNASRPIEKSEITKCNENGVKDIVEIKIGYDGIVLANSTVGKKFQLSKKQVFLALAAEVPSADNKKLIANPYQLWSDIDINLPKTKITVYGPPPTSGTRDAFVELLMEEYCLNDQQFITTYNDKNLRKKKCHIIRSDNKFIEAGENDNLIIQKLRNDHDALGIFGFNFLQENRNLIQAATIDNVEPSFDNIASSKYKVSRPLFIYFKKEHLVLLPEIKDFVKEIISEEVIGKKGYLQNNGLIPLNDEELKRIRASL